MTLNQYLRAGLGLVSQANLIFQNTYELESMYIKRKETSNIGLCHAVFSRLLNFESQRSPGKSLAGDVPIFSTTPNSTNFKLSGIRNSSSIIHYIKNFARNFTWRNIRRRPSLVFSWTHFRIHPGISLNTCCQNLSDVRKAILEKDNLNGIQEFTRSA